MIEDVLNDMKNAGIPGALVRSDGIVIYSTLALNDMNAKVVASIANISDALIKKFDDNQKDLEIALDNGIFVMYPIKSHLFCGMIQDREQKKTVMDYAEKAKALL